MPVGLGLNDFIITQRYLNTASYAGDPTPGAVVSTANVSGSIVQPYSGQLGKIAAFGKDAANYYSDLTNGQQLYPGNYQYVQFLSTGGNAVQGQVVYWVDDTTNLLSGGGFKVTATEAAALLGLVAGIALGNTTAGNYWFIQVAGIAQVKFHGTQGPATPLAGDLVFADYSNPSNLAYDPTQSGAAPIISALKAVLGVLWANTLPGAIGPVMLGGLCGPKYVPGGGGGEG